MAKPPQKPENIERLYHELEALPPNKVGEIINGALPANPRPAAPHGRVASAPGMDIGSLFAV